MRILVTGGLGYIGSVLVQSLQNATEIDKITIYDNFSRKNFGLLISSKLDGNKVQVVKGDLLNGRLLRKCVQEHDIVIHLAGKVSNPSSDGLAHPFEQVNHWGTAQLVDAIEEHPVQHLVFLSSTSVYGHSTEGVEIETNPHPTTFYGISKFDAEQEIQRLKGKVKYHILRSANVYGYSPSLRIGTVVNKFIFEANFQNQINIIGDGKQIRPFIHVDKLVALLKRLVRGLEVDSGVYNLFQNNYSINELADAIQTLYPNLDKISLNKDYKTRSLLLNGPCKIMELAGVKPGDLIEELEAFKARFAY